MSDVMERIKMKIIEASAELIEATVTDTIIPLDVALAVIDEELAKEPQESDNRVNGEKGKKYMKLNEMLRYCAIKNNDNFRLIDTYYMSESEKVFLLTILSDYRIEKYFFDSSYKMYRGNKLQKSIDYYKNRLRHAETLEECIKYNNELEVLQLLLNDMILSSQK